MTTTNPPTVRSVQIVPVQPEPADEKRIAYLRANRQLPLDDILYLVKIYLDEDLPITGEGYALYVGDEWIQKYSGFNGGIYFNVYNPQFIEQHKGQMVRFTQDHEQFIETKGRLPDLSPPEPEDVPPGPTAAARGMTLPTKRQALQE